LSQKELKAFFDEVPLTDMQLAARVLPSPAGFRRTSEAGIIRQKEILARRLSRSTANDRDYHGLYVVWRIWVDKWLPGGATIQGMIDDVEEAAGVLDDPEAQRTAVQPHVEKILEKLKTESQQNRCTREVIEKFFTFSPFPETPHARSIIASAKPASEVQRDATLNELPTRLAQDENEIQSIKNDLGSLLDRVDRLGTDVTKTAASAADALVAAHEAKASTSKIGDTVRDLVLSRDKSLPVGESAGQPELATKLEATVGEIDGLRGEVRALRESIPDNSGIADSIQSLTEAASLASVARDQQAEALRTLAAGLEETKRDVLALMDARTGDDGVALLAKRLASLEDQVHTLTVAPITPPYETSVLRPSQPHSTSSYPGNAELRRGPIMEDVGRIASPAPSFAVLTEVVAKALQGLGLRKTAAQVFGEECTAAIACRQIVFLQGAFANRVARSLAHAVSGSNCARISIPIGMQDGEELREAAYRQNDQAPTALPALVVEGINRSALDVTREALTDLIDPLAAGLGTAKLRTIVFATLAQGVASLPIEPEHFELGPVFNVDVLDWRRLAISETSSPAAIAPDLDRTMFAELTGSAVADDEALRLARLFATKRNPAVERNILLAHRALEALRSDRKALTPLQSLHFGWLLPYWRALNIAREQVDSELDGGKVNGQAADPRLAAVFADAFPPDTKRGGTA
jgi:hypothetical protein